MKKSKLWLALVLAVALVAAACGGGDEAIDNVIEEDESAAEGTSETTAAASDGDGDEVAGGEEAFAGTIKIGAALSETGKFSVEGKDSREGYDTWVEWVNNDSNHVVDRSVNTSVVVLETTSSLICLPGWILGHPNQF